MFSIPALASLPERKYVLVPSIFQLPEPPFFLSTLGLISTWPGRKAGVAESQDI